MFYGARYYDPGLGRFLQADTIVPQPGNPQSLNRYSYGSNNPVKYIDPSGHQGCEPNDQGCWESRWYQSHGYEQTNGNWVQTGYYYFADSDAASNLMRDILEGHHTLPSNASFHMGSGRLQLALEHRGQDNAASTALGTFATALDFTDFAIRGGFVQAYVVEQVATALLAGPEGAVVGLGAGEAAYRSAQGFLFVVDALGFGAISLADVSAGRTSISLGQREIAVGADSLVNMFSLSVSSTPLPIIPGAFIGLGGDTIQITYDMLRMSGRLPAYSLIAQWK